MKLDTTWTTLEFKLYFSTDFISGLVQRYKTEQLRSLILSFVPRFNLNLLKIRKMTHGLKNSRICPRTNSLQTILSIFIFLGKKIFLNVSKGI